MRFLKAALLRRTLLSALVAVAALSFVASGLALSGVGTEQLRALAGLRLGAAVQVPGRYERLASEHSAVVLRRPGSRWLRATTVTGTISTGGPSVTTTISSSGDTANISFDGTAGQRLGLALSNVTIGASQFASVYVTVLKPGGSTLSTPGWVGTSGAETDFPELPVSGTYTIVLDPDGANTGSATLTLSEDVTGSVVIGGASSSVTMSRIGQNGRVSFAGTAGQRLGGALSNVTLGTGSASVYVTVLKPDGSTLSTPGWFGTSNGEFDLPVLPSTGTYSIFLDPNKFDTGSATLTLSEDVASSVVVDGASSGVTMSRIGQNGRVTFAGTAGQQLGLALSSVTIGTSQAASVYTTVLKPDGSTLDSLGWAGTNGKEFDLKVLPVNGTYTIFLDPDSLNTGSATLTLSADLVGSLVYAEPQTLTLRQGQNAVLTFSGTASLPVKVTVSASTIGATALTIRNSDGSQLGSWPSVGAGGAVSATLPTNGTYSIFVDPQSVSAGTSTLLLETTAAQIVTSAKTVSPVGPASGTQAMTFGNTVSVQVGDAVFAPRAYKLELSLGFMESLQQLSDGSVAVVRPFVEDPAGEDDGTGGQIDGNGGSSLPVIPIAADPATLDDGTPDPAADNVLASGEADPGEPTSSALTSVEPVYDDADTLAAADGMTLVNAAQDLADGQVVAVLAPPAVAGATATLTAGTNAVTLRIAPSETPTFPIQAPVQIGFSADINASGPNLTPTDCPTFGRILTFNPNGWGTLLNAFASYPGSCARYYIAVPPLPSADPRGGGIPANIRGKNTAANVVAAKTKFFAAATLHWAGWHLDDANVNPYAVGVAFRQRMETAGYDVISGDTWVVEEVPRTVRTDPAKQERFLRLVRGLYNGPTGKPARQGLIFFEIEHQDGTPTPIATYKSELEMLLSNPSSPDLWTSTRLRKYLLVWGEEAYSWCYLVCVPDASLGQKAAHTNAYLEHPARLAFASGAPPVAQDARDFFDRSYQPVVNAFWANSVQQDPKQDPAYKTFGLNSDQMQRLVSLQIFSARSWATTNANLYPDRRIGFAWNEHAQRSISARRALARRIAQGLRGAFSLNGTARYGCELSGATTKLCNPALAASFSPAPAFTEIWTTFGAW